MQQNNLRLVNVALGVWLLISSFVARRGSPMFVNAWVTGVIVIATALLSNRSPNLRFVNTAAGIWLIASLFAWPDYSSAMVWNTCLVGAAIAMVSLVGPREAEMFSG